MARRGSNMMGRTRFEDQGVTALFESLNFASAQPEDHSGRQARKGRDPVVVPTFPEDRTSEGSEETVTVSHRTLVPQACSESQQPLGDTDQIREEAVRGQLDKDVLHVDPTGRDGETGSCSQKDEGLMAAARPTTMPRFPSLDMNSPNAVCTPSSSSEYSGGNISSEHSVTSSDPIVDLGKGSFANMGGVVQLRQCADAQQGFLPRSPKDLQEFLMQISYCQRDFGIFVTDVSKRYHTQQLWTLGRFGASCHQPSDPLLLPPHQPGPPPPPSPSVPIFCHPPPSAEVLQIKKSRSPKSINFKGPF